MTTPLQNPRHQVTLLRRLGANANMLADEMQRQIDGIHAGADERPAHIEILKERIAEDCSELGETGAALLQVRSTAP